MKLIEAASLARYIGMMLAVLIIVSEAARAEPVSSFDATPGKLKADSRGGARIVCASGAS